MYVYRKSFLHYVDGDTTKSATLFQMIERFLVAKKKRVSTVNAGHNCTRTIRYFSLQESIDITAERLSEVTVPRWKENWQQLLDILEAMKANYFEEYGDPIEKTEQVQPTERALHLRKVRSTKNKMYRLYRQNLFREKWKSEMVWN